MECQECSAKCEVGSVKCVVWSVKNAVRSVMRSGASNVTCETGHNFRTMHTPGRAWLAHGACKFYR